MDRRSTSGVSGAPFRGQGLVAVQAGARLSVMMRTLLAAVAVLGLVAGCGDEVEEPSYTDPMGVGEGGGSSSSGSTSPTGGGHATPCTEGQTRSCRNELGVHGQVKSCFIGVQTCKDGQWGQCIVGEVDIAASEEAGEGGEGGGEAGSEDEGEGGGDGG